MTDRIDRHLVKAMIEVLLFLEFTDEKLLDARVSIKAMQDIAIELAKMDEPCRRELCQQFVALANHYTESSKKQFVQNLPEILGLEEPPEVPS